MTMQLSDIMEALEHGDTREIEKTFRVLVDYPHEDRIEGATHIQRLLLFDMVCPALIKDKSFMPTRTVEAVNEHFRIGRPFVDTTYAAGAGRIMEWRAQLRDKTWERLEAKA